MRKFTKPFEGVPSGEIYPVAFQAGDNCPAELEAAADSLGVLGEADEDDRGDPTGGDGGGDAPAPEPAAELEAAADEAQQPEEKPSAAPSESRRARR
jgi:hypothetical protein